MRFNQIPKALPEAQWFPLPVPAHSPSLGYLPIRSLD